MVGKRFKNLLWEDYVGVEYVWLNIDKNKSYITKSFYRPLTQRQGLDIEVLEEIEAVCGSKEKVIVIREILVCLT